MQFSKYFVTKTISVSAINEKKICLGSPCIEELFNWVVTLTYGNSALLLHPC